MKIELATPEQVAQYQHFDHTKLSAINTCPTYGLIRYAHHKVIGSTSRPMALEAGKTMHECFSAIRLMQLYHLQRMPEHAEYAGRKLFDDRYDAIIEANCGLEYPDALRMAALSCLETAGYIDDPFDRRRTYSNLETALLYYVMQYDSKRYPVWVSDYNDPTSLVGIEIPFTLFIDFEDALVENIIYTGRIDGLHCNGDRVDDLLIQENKTASRLNEAWRMSFEMSHQVTGYTVAASVLSKHLVKRALIMGVSIPLPRDVGNGYTTTHVTRHDYSLVTWAQWLKHTVELHTKYYLTPTEAPKYTHSCNRYFRPCAFIPLCASDPAERRHIFENDMQHDEWSPLDDGAANE